MSKWDPDDILFGCFLAGCFIIFLLITIGTFVAMFVEGC